jgi:hypothetical protein
MKTIIALVVILLLMIVIAFQSQQIREWRIGGQLIQDSLSNGLETCRAEQKDTLKELEIYKAGFDQLSGLCRAK